MGADPAHDLGGEPFGVPEQGLLGLDQRLLVDRGRERVEGVGDDPGVLDVHRA